MFAFICHNLHHFVANKICFHMIYKFCFGTPMGLDDKYSICNRTHAHKSLVIQMEVYFAPVKVFRCSCSAPMTSIARPIWVLLLGWWLCSASCRCQLSGTNSAISTYSNYPYILIRLCYSDSKCWPCCCLSWLHAPMVEAGIPCCR